MNADNLERLAAYLRGRGCDAALLSSPWTLTWLTGYAPPIQIGPSPFDGGPALGWWQGGELTLILSDMEAPAAREAGAQVREYVGYAVDAPLDAVQHETDALAAILPHGAGTLAGGTVAVEMRFLTAPLWLAVQRALDGATLLPLQAELDGLRAVKTPEEVTRLRAALALCDLSQAEVHAALRPGISEIELWGRMKARLEVAAGGRLPILADLVAGPRTGDIGGSPGSYVLREGDALIADIVPCLKGYWGDICGTHFVGEPPAEMRKIYSMVREALRMGVEMVRPGLRACDLDAALRGAVRDAGYAPYPHHSGHGLGVTFHEEPRIVPYNDMPLAPGMVIALEPGIYLPGTGGVRLEDIVLVTEDGCELLTHHLDRKTFEVG